MTDVIKNDTDHTKIALSGIWIKAEVNLSSLPLFALSRQDVRRRHKMAYRITMDEEGHSHEASWIITANAAYRQASRYPIRFHSPCIISAVSSVSVNRDRTNVVSACLSEGLSPPPTIDSQRMLYSKTAEERITTTFHLYDRVIFRGRTLPDGKTAETNYSLSDNDLEKQNRKARKEGAKGAKKFQFFI